LAVEGIDKSISLAAVRRGAVSGKLKNIRCYKPLPRNGWLRHSMLEKV
jgi:hypothetical protein